MIDGRQSQLAQAADRGPRAELRLAVAVGLLVAAAWLSGLAGGYVFDDRVTPLGDPASQSLGAWVRYLLVTLRPLTKLSYALEASAGLGDLPAVRRAVTVVLHACAAGLLYWLARRFVPARAAAALAVVWGVHPVHAESVLAICGRTSALSNALVLGALAAYAEDRRRLSGLLVLLAALARETALAAALPLVVMELGRAAPSVRERARRLAPVAAGLLVAAVWIVATPRAQALADFSLHGRPVLASAIAQVSAVPVGLLLYVAPWRLSVDHGWPLPTSPLAPEFVAGVALLALAGVTAWIARRRAPALALGAALWLAALLPTQTLVPKLDPLTERPLSLALAGLLLVAAPVAASLLGGSRRVARLASAVVFVALALALATATTTRGILHGNELALWQDAASKSRTNPRPPLNAAALLLEAGRPAEARPYVEQAQRIDPLNPRASALARRILEEEEGHAP